MEDDIMIYMDLCTDSEQDVVDYSESVEEEIPTINDFDEF